MTRRRLPGGDLAETWQVGDTVEKTYARPELARAEAAGLAWLRVPDGPPVPEVLDLRGGTLVLEHVPPGDPTEGGAERLGAELARLHAPGAVAYGAAPSAHVLVGTVLLDVAAHGGHPELDPALLALFGGPHLEVVLASWAAASGAADGRRARLALHQVHTLLFHAVAFGGGYLAEARRALGAYL